MSFLINSFIFGGGSTLPFVVEHHAVSAGASQALSLTGAVAGDFALICVSNATGVTAPAGWTSLGAADFNWSATGYRQVYYSKTLSSGDITAGSVTVTDVQAGSTLMVVIYRGPSIATPVSTNNTAAGATVTCTGFTKSLGSIAIVGFSGDAHTGSTIVQPSLMTQRVAPFGTTNLTVEAADINDPSTYANGTNLSWTGFVGADQVAQIFELT